MFIIKPKLKLKDHKDADGNVYHKVYHEGDLIPASEVEIEGFEVRTTREFDKEFFVNYRCGCSRDTWKVSVPPKESAQELLDITNFCREHGSWCYQVSCPEGVVRLMRGRVSEDDP